LKNYIKSSPVKGVTSTGSAKEKGESRTNEHLHSSRRD